MPDPQTWTLLGVFAALMLGGMTLISSSTNRVIRSSIGGLRGEMNSRFAAVDAKFEATDAKIGGLRGEMRGEIGGLRREMNSRFEAVDAKFDALGTEMNARFDTVNTQIQHLDRDVTALTKRYFGGSTEA